MILNRLVPILLAVVLILVFAYVALGAVYGVNCPWQFCKSPALSTQATQGAQAVALKYYHVDGNYHVLGKVDALPPCTWLYTNTMGGLTDPLIIALRTQSATSGCKEHVTVQTFYVEADRSGEVPIRVTLNDSPVPAALQQVESESSLSF